MYSHNLAEKDVKPNNFYSSQTEEEKAVFQRRAREAELIAARIVEDCERRAAEAEQLRNELTQARLSERVAKEKLQGLISASTATAVYSPSGTVREQ